MTPPLYHSTHPIFSPDDRWLFFFSTRPIGDSLDRSEEMRWNYNEEREREGGRGKERERRLRVFAISLTLDVTSDPFKWPSELSASSYSFGAQPIPFKKYPWERQSRYNLDEIESRIYPVPFFGPNLYSDLFFGKKSDIVTLYTTFTNPSGLKTLTSIDIPSHPYLVTPKDVTILSESIYLVTSSDDGSIVAAVMKGHERSDSHFSFLKAGEKNWRPIDVTPWSFPVTPPIEWKQVFLCSCFSLLTHTHITHTHTHTHTHTTEISIGRSFATFGGK